MLGGAAAATSWAARSQRALTAWTRFSRGLGRAKSKNSLTSAARRFNLFADDTHRLERVVILKAGAAEPRSRNVTCRWAPFSGIANLVGEPRCQRSNRGKLLTLPNARGERVLVGDVLADGEENDLFLGLGGRVGELPANVTDLARTRPRALSTMSGSRRCPLPPAETRCRGLRGARQGGARRSSCRGPRRGRSR